MTSKSNQPLTFLSSAASSIFAWLFVVGGTVSLFLIGLVFFWPVSFIFEKASGRLSHQIAQVWGRMICRILPFWKIQAEGLERIEKGRLYAVISNHQSMLDILVVLAALPLHFKFIAKRELFWIPFFGWHLWLAGYIPLRRGDPESGRQCLEKARHWVRRGVSVLFFPEGTRSPDGEIHEFKAGAFKMALEEKVDLLPLAIWGTREAVPKYSWRLKRRSTLFLKVLPPIKAREFAGWTVDRLRSSVRSQIVEAFSSRRNPYV